jgi:hypothetical protein
MLQAGDFVGLTVGISARYWGLFQCKSGAGNVTISEIVFSKEGSPLTPDAAAASTEGFSTTAGNAFDGNPSVNWSANSGDNSPWIYADFTDPVSVDNVSLKTRSDGFYDQCPSFFLVCYSDNTKAWRPLAYVTLGSFTSAGQEQNADLPPSLLG